MSDIVEIARNHSKRNGIESDAKWHITFLDGETRTGPLIWVEDNVYLLEGRNGDYGYYFDSSSVIRIHPAK